ncbi:MAG: hypothetical protein K5644_01630 [Lachnospiraceae bacterium]|nr:hypothetical protein [Lachnospiraceae bacterium]
MGENMEDHSSKVVREDTYVHISEHAYKRMKERNGWNRKTANRMIKRIYINGQRPDEVKGYIKIWIVHKLGQVRENDEYVLYGDYVYIFNNNVLVTSFRQPCREKVLKHYKYS